MLFYPSANEVKIIGQMCPVIISQDRCYEPFNECLHMHMPVFMFPSQDELPPIGKNHVVFFEGGTDVNPLLYNGVKLGVTDEPDVFRDSFEKRVFDHAVDHGAAMVGICRGAQFLTAMAGGKLVQHVTGHAEGKMHAIETCFGNSTMQVTSSHHQMMYPFDIPHRLIAWSKEKRSKVYQGISKEEEKKITLEPEIVWYPEIRALCIQPHPEWMSYSSPLGIFCRQLFQHFFFETK